MNDEMGTDKKRSETGISQVNKFSFVLYAHNLSKAFSEFQFPMHFKAELSKVAAILWSPKPHPSIPLLIFSTFDTTK